ncbi:DUF4179 domain-containing protein [Lysinibacillus sp. KU-BSD001]|uniref:DUF4179 domain-containing protein n=1 Tax=Lysinibacillus sp. KU-BSD001 TaxID=3141328 RepID=UPI0036EB3AA6
MKGEKDFLRIDIDEIESFDVSNHEVKTVIQHVLREPKKVYRVSKWGVAAVLAIGIGSISILSIPTIASKLPIIEQLLSYFSEDKKLVLFNDYATAFGQTAESNGMTMKIEDAVYDGYLVSIAFSIESEKPLDDLQFVKSIPKITGHELYKAEEHMQKVDENTYIGFLTYEVADSAAQNSSIELTWSPKGFYDNHYNSVISGDWTFSFELNKLDLQETIVDKTITSGVRDIVIDRIASTGYTTIIYFSGDIDFMTEFIFLNVKDNLGNDYQFAPTHGQMVTNDFLTGTVPIFGLDQNASSLLVTPTIYTMTENKPLTKEETLGTVEVPLK